MSVTENRLKRFSYGFYRKKKPFFKSLNDIHLWQVLVYLNRKERKYSVSLSCQFYYIHKRTKEIMPSGIYWDFEKPLGKQKKEVLDFIFKH